MIKKYQMLNLYYFKNILLQIENKSFLNGIIFDENKIPNEKKL